MAENKEIRQLQIEYRTTEGSRKIEGVAIVFNQLSEDLGGFREMIIPDAVQDVIEQSDIFFLYNHNQDRGFLARSRNGKGSLTTEVKEDGVHFSFDAPHTALGDEVLEHLRRGDINQCSFAFRIAEDAWEKQSDGLYIRTIKRFERLFDMSLVDTPAYSQTTACVRFNEILEEEKKAAEEQMRKLEAEEKQKAEEELRAKLNEYYSNLKSEYSKYIEQTNLNQ